MRREGGGGLYMGWGEPAARGDLSPVGRATGPPPPSPGAALPRDLFVKKNLPKGPVALAEGDRGPFSKITETGIYF